MRFVKRHSFPVLWAAFGLVAVGRAHCEEASKSSSPAKVALLPLLEVNAAAKKISLSKTLTESVRFELTDRPEIALISHGQVMDYLQSEGVRRDHLETVATLQKVSKHLGADFILVGSCARFGSTVEEATYLDFRVFSGQTGELVGWASERSDKIREASMTISSPEMEQRERLGASLAAIMRQARNRPANPPARKFVAVFPFKESTDDTYQDILARMFGTELMTDGHYQVLPLVDLPVEVERKQLLDWAKRHGAQLAFFGEVISGTSDAVTVRVSQVSVESGKVMRQAEDTFTSDMHLRRVAVYLAQAFSDGGQRILWRMGKFLGKPLYTTPAFGEGKVFLGAPGPAIVALDPFNGHEVWTYDCPDTTSGIGEFFYSPIVFGHTVCARGPGQAHVYRRDFASEKPKLLPPGYFATVGQRQQTLDLPLSASQGLLLVPSGTFEVVAAEVGDEEKLVERWRFRERSPVFVALGKPGEKVVVACRNGRVSALGKADGKPLWQRQLPDRIHAAPLVDSEKVFVGTENGERFCLNLTDGAVAWSRPQPGRNLASPSTDGGKVCFSNDSGQMTCYAIEDGKEAWNVRLEGAPQTALATYRGLVYASCSDGSVYCLKGADGSVQWRTRLHDSVHSAPVIVPTEALLANPEAEPASWTEHFDHAIFVTTAEGLVYALGGTAGP